MTMGGVHGFNTKKLVGRVQHSPNQSTIHFGALEWRGHMGVDVVAVSYKFQNEGLSMGAFEWMVWGWLGTLLHNARVQQEGMTMAHTGVLNIVELGMARTHR